MNKLITINDIHKRYNNEEEILKGVSFEIKEGEILSLIGTSGSGKTTLLNIIGSLDKPDEGEVLYLGNDILKYKEKELNKYRNKEIGFIYQFHNLIETFSVLDNVMLPNLLINSKKKAKVKAIEILTDLGLKEKINNFPNELSGGQKQRVAIARALINDPKLILADEPTGSLDEENTANVLKLIKEINKKRNTTFLIITHDNNIAKNTDRIICMESGIVK